MLCLLRFGRICRRIGRVMCQKFNALTLYWVGAFSSILGVFRRCFGLCGGNLPHAHISPDAAICSLYRNVEEAWVSFHFVLVNLNHGSDWEHALNLFAETVVGEIDGFGG